MATEAVSIAKPSAAQGRAQAQGRQPHGIEERLFTFAFSGLVYPQIWEDPVVDLEALDLKHGEHLVAIASGGCNILSYVTAVDVRVTGIDLNPAHVALNKLKLAAARHLPDYATFYRFFAHANPRRTSRPTRPISRRSSTR